MTEFRSFLVLVCMFSHYLQLSSSMKLGEQRHAETKFHSNVSEKKELEGEWKFSDESECPEPNVILPCVCTIEDTANIKLECTSITTEQLFNVFQQEFPVKNMSVLYVINSFEPLILNFSTNQLTFEEIGFNDVGSLAIYDEFLADSSARLKELKVIHAELTSDGFPFSTLSNYKVLDYLHLSRTGLTSLPTISSASLTFINIQNHDIDTIIPG